MHKSITRILSILKKEPDIQKMKADELKEDIISQIMNAKYEWDCLTNNFNYIPSEESEYYSYILTAAERKYRYLITKLKNMA